MTFAASNFEAILILTTEHGVKLNGLAYSFEIAKWTLF